MSERNLEIPGLSVKQSIIADALWECETEAQVLQLFEVFPVVEVILIKELMIAAALDVAVQDDLALAQEYLRRFT